MCRKCTIFVETVGVLLNSGGIMKTAVKLYIIVIVLFSFTNQIIGQDTIRTDTLKSTVVKKDFNAKPVFTPKLHFGMDFGAGYIVGSGFGSGSYTTWAPSLSYAATQKLTLQFSGVLTRGPSFSMGKPGSPITMQSLNQNANTFFLYTSGQYALTPKITLSGSVYKTLNPDKNSALNPYALDLNGADFGLTYKVSKNFSVGAQFRYTNTNNPFYLYNNYLNPTSPWNNFNGFNNFHQNGINSDF